MDRENDIQRLFSWLQTPDLRYREFAGERELPDRPETPGAGNAAEGVSPPALPARAAAEHGGLHQPEFAEPTDSPAPGAPPSGPGLFGGAYRSGDRNSTGAESRPPAAETAAPPAESRQDVGRSLDSVFGRLAGTRARLPDPRERPRPGSETGSETGPPGSRTR